MAKWAKIKGIGLLGTGDFTHPLWYREIKSYLKQTGEGVYSLSLSESGEYDTRFLLTTELSCIYLQGGKSRRIHLVVLAPNLSVVEKINASLLRRGFNLISDGRPILGISARDLAGLLLSIDEKIIIIPAHIWTPWFSLYGAMSGFDSIDECFGEYSKYIYAVETGLSSDPAMNWRISELGRKKIVSFGDAHSPIKLGREATVFQIKNLKVKSQNHNFKFKITYKDIYDAIAGDSNGDWEIAYTVEFYPEEGKYHFSGHRKCGVVLSANDVKTKGTTCPVCGKKLTLGVTYQVEKLSSRDTETEAKENSYGVRFIVDKDRKQKPYALMVPLHEIIAEVLSVQVGTKKVIDAYDNLIRNLGSEFTVLLETPLEKIKKVAGGRLAEAVEKVRAGDIRMSPGYDGVFGKVSIWGESGQGENGGEKAIDQSRLF
jgi:uncharacterized protein (TIGR00375 family)